MKCSVETTCSCNIETTHFRETWLMMSLQVDDTFLIGLVSLCWNLSILYALRTFRLLSNGPNAQFGLLIPDQHREFTNNMQFYLCVSLLR